MRGNLVYNNIDLEIESKKELSLEKIAFKKYRNNVCQFCGKTIKSWGDKTVDHSIPRARGGLDCPSNWRISCKECNQTKSKMTELEYRKFIKETANLKKLAKNNIKNIVLKMLDEKGEINWEEAKNMTINNLVERFEIIEEQLNKELNGRVKKEDAFSLDDKIMCCMYDTSKIVVSKTIANNIKQLNKNNKKIKNILNEYYEGDIGIIKTYKGILLPTGFQLYYAYNDVLNLKKVKIMNVLTEDILTKSEKSFLRHDGMIE